MTGHNNSGVFAIVLYIPDAIAQELKDKASPGGVIPDGWSELEFLPPIWWEHSHTVKLGLLQAQTGETS